ncbi:DUF2161 domain-containing phosphodiesterase [Oricola thermophila]|uniref:DUF2161 domain-containing phosphodiesterase n=1 Tax=Oricola thermophila TaxID=2742145 RepID=A0A6N1VDL0_9HYPH|nr:DUF2161 family putative PD-(D/E)XK-type phosphodiesterase [Oricola thermophila]QKV18808.1 hypothetical protein HTY61_10275 [Oricola thermophila]
MKPKETDLYPPVKKLLEGQGYEVKSEVGPADVFAVRGDEPPVIVELKTGFTLSLFHQAVDRLAITDSVYVAVPRGRGRAFLSSLRANMKLCRRLGLGLITVRMDDGFCEVHLDPGPFSPRKSKVKTTRLLREFARRVGDPNQGGTNRTTIVTAYRQDAMRVASWLAQNGPAKAAEVAKATGVERARAIMADDHYGWFERVERGIYRLSPKGRQAAELPPL